MGGIGLHATAGGAVCAQAAAAYRRLCDQFSEKTAFWVNLGLAYAQQEPARLEEAEKSFRQALAIRPRDPDVLHNLSVVLHRHGRLTEALELARQATEADPGKGYVWTGLGDVCRDLGDYPGAYRAYQRALARSRSWAPTRLGLARLYFAVGRYSDTLRQAQVFLSSTEGDAARWARDRPKRRH